MPIPDLLQQMLVDSLAAMNSDPSYHLSPISRLSLYHFLNPKDPSVPRFARGWLGILTARRVLPIWHAYCPSWTDQNQIPERLLDIARNSLRGEMDLKKAWREANDLWYVSANLGEPIVQRNRDVPNKAFYACDTALKALHEALNIEFLEKASEIAHASDPYLQDWERDSAASAMLAESGGADAGPLDITKRQEFWKWWLTQAVPMAWLRGGQPVP